MLSSRASRSRSSVTVSPSGMLMAFWHGSTLVRHIWAETAGESARAVRTNENTSREASIAESVSHKIPLNPPLRKGDFLALLTKRDSTSPPLVRGNFPSLLVKGDFLNPFAEGNATVPSGKGVPSSPFLVKREPSSSHLVKGNTYSPPLIRGVGGISDASPPLPSGPERQLRSIKRLSRDKWYD